jgi:hypothetical protein
MGIETSRLLQGRLTNFVPRGVPSLPSRIGGCHFGAPTEHWLPCIELVQFAQPWVKLLLKVFAHEAQHWRRQIRSAAVNKRKGLS